MKFLVLIIAFLVPAVGLAQTIDYQWDPHPQASLIDGFRLYQSKVSGVYGAQPAGVFIGGNLTAGSVPVSFMGRVCSVLRAYAGDIESDNSNEICTVVKPNPPSLKSSIWNAIKRTAGLLKKDKGLRGRVVYGSNQS